MYSPPLLCVYICVCACACMFLYALVSLIFLVQKIFPEFVGFLRIVWKFICKTQEHKTWGFIRQFKYMGSIPPQFSDLFFYLCTMFSSFPCILLVFDVLSPISHCLLNPLYRSGLLLMLLSIQCSFSYSEIFLSLFRMATE